MCKFIKDWLNKYVLKTKITQYTLSIDGKYFVLYMLDKYINKTHPDNYIEKYEKFIDNETITLKNRNFYANFTKPIDFKKELTLAEEREIAILYLFILFVNFMTDEQKHFYINYITNLNYKKFIEEYSSFLLGGDNCNAIQENAGVSFSK